MEKTVVLEEYAKTRSRRNGNLKKYGLIALFMGPFLLAFIVFFVYPLFYGIYISLTNYTLGKPEAAVWNNFDNYKILLDFNYNPKMTTYLTRDNFWNSFANSFVFSVIMVPIAIIVPLFLAILINTKPPAFKAFRAMIYLPSIVPLTAAGSIFMMIFMDGSQHGLLAEFFGVETKWFLDIWFSFNLGEKVVSVPYSWIPIFLMCFWGGWGGNFIILNAGLQNVPKSLYEAASIDGCSSWKKVLNVTIPGIKPQLVLCLFTTIIGYLGLYGQNFTLTSGGPTISFMNSKLPGGGGTSTIMYFIQDIIANNSDFTATLYGMGAAASIVFALFVGIISGVQMWCTRDKKTGTKISEAYSKWHKVR